MSKQILMLIGVTLVLMMGAEAFAQTGAPRMPEAAHADEEGDHDEEGIVHLTVDQQQAVGLAIEVLAARVLGTTLRAPGEVMLNAYATSQLTPRIQAQVVERHARMGETVTEGQPLVTLSSVPMAEAQGGVIVAEREWVRVQGLGREIVSASRYIEAQVAAQLARSTVSAYGMSLEQIEGLIGSGDASDADGRFTLLSLQDGTVVRDDFIVGEAIEPGRVLFEITDESTLWVEARLPAQEAGAVALGDLARVGVRGRWLEGRVIQAFHALDEGTRTLPIRVEVANPDDSLHPGMFVDAHILGESGEAVLAVPEAAVLRSPDGDWQVFVEEEPGEYRPVEVDIVRTVAGLAVIDGLPPGTRVVTAGAFFLSAELAKGGFDIHGH